MPGLNGVCEQFYKTALAIEVALFWKMAIVNSSTMLQDVLVENPSIVQNKKCVIFYQSMVQFGILKCIIMDEWGWFTIKNNVK